MNAPLVTIGVCTYRRPEGIRKCLATLLEQETDFPFEIVVTENEAAMPSREIVESFLPQAKEKGIELRYFCEPIQNIALSRNCCVREARGEFVAFLDDDEWAEPQWLAKLIEVQKETTADVVWGIVHPIFPEGYPEYLKRLPNLEQYAQAADIEYIQSFCTNNLLLRASLRALRSEFFDLTFGISGCSDAELSCFLDGQGKTMVRTNRAVVYEVQALSRGSFRFQFWKPFCVTIALARIYRKHYYGLHGNWAIMKLLWSSWKDLLKNVPSIFLRPSYGWAYVVFHSGRVAGILGYYLGIRPKAY